MKGIKEMEEIKQMEEMEEMRENKETRKMRQIDVNEAVRAETLTAMALTRAANRNGIRIMISSHFW
jgi:hypothetical protein